MIPATHRPTWAAIDLDAVVHNLKIIKTWTKAQKAIAVLKANAYGLGAVPVAKVLAQSNGGPANEFAVANLDEALELRTHHIQEPIWVFGVQPLAHLNEFISHQVTMTIPDNHYLNELMNQLHEGQLISVALPIDTGMERIGFQTKADFQTALDLIATHPQIQLAQVYTHFASADSLDQTQFDQQVALWHEITDEVSFDRSLISMANSATSLWHTDNQQIVFDKIRVGDVISGVNPSDGEIELPDQLDLQPALSLHTQIEDKRLLKKGQSVSYGATYTAEVDQPIGILPIGYADGWLRRMQGATVLINGQRQTIIGRIMMDLMVVTLSSTDEVGDLVTLIGKQDAEIVSLTDQAQYAQTINYEIQTSLNNRIQRRYYVAGQEVTDHG